MNDLKLGGRLCREPELKKTTTGKSVLNNSVAIRVSKDKTVFIPFTAWEKTAETISMYFHKGDYMLGIGHVDTHTTTDASGGKHTITDIVVDRVEFTGSKQRESNPQTTSYGGVDFNTGSGIDSDDLPW